MDSKRTISERKKSYPSKGQVQIFLKIGLLKVQELFVWQSITTSELWIEFRQKFSMGMMYLEKRYPVSNSGMNDSYWTTSNELQTF